MRNGIQWFSKSHCLLFMNEKQEQLISFLMNMISIYRSLSVNAIPKRAKSNLAHACPVSMRLLWERKRKGQNRMRNGINRRGFVFKIPLLTVHERETGTDDIVPNEHDQYLPFTLSPCHS
jgi:hypothetical protein